ncbi:MAG: zinc ABC transporter substrate-binding protein [Paracoccaceae bacterium]|nr:zinc ABC transporter substrate-binding protein [Paracoccaceae bacterium]
MRSLIVLALALAAARPALAAVPKVVTDFAPIQSLVMQVMGDLGTPEMLSQPGSDPHSFTLKPSQAGALAKADVIFWDGPELMPALDSAIKALGVKALSVPLLDEGGGKTRTFSDGQTIDPHAWLDPTNAQAWLGTIATTLSKLDPDHATTYAANAAQAEDALKTLDAQLTKELAPARGKPIVEFHDAMGYFAAHYGLNIIANIELGDAAKPSAGRLAELRQTLVGGGAVCVFPEAGRDPRYISVVTAGTGTRIGAPQDPAGVMLTEPPTADFYGKLLTDLAKTISDCIAGPKP